MFDAWVAVGIPCGDSGISSILSKSSSSILTKSLEGVVVLSAGKATGGAESCGGLSGESPGDVKAGWDDSPAALGGLANASTADVEPPDLLKKSEAFDMTETPLTSRFPKETCSGTAAAGGVAAAAAGGGEENASAAELVLDLLGEVYCKGGAGIAGDATAAGLFATGSCLARVACAGAGLENAVEASPAGLEKSAEAE